MKSVTNRYRLSFRRIPSVVMESFTRLLKGPSMNKSTETTPSKSKRVSKAKAAPKAEAPLSEAAIAAAIASVKAPATPKKTGTKSAAPTAPKTSKSKSTPVKSSASRKKEVPVHVAPSQEMINQMIEEAAYFLAEKRHFAPGFDEQDWLEAKRQILAQIKGADSPLK